MQNVAVTIQWQAPVTARTEVMSMPVDQAHMMLSRVVDAVVTHATEQGYSQVVITVSKNKQREIAIDEGADMDALTGKKR